MRLLGVLVGIVDLRVDIAQALFDLGRGGAKGQKDTNLEERRG